MSMPNNEQAEAGLLARLLIDPAQIPVISDKLSADDFYRPEFKTAYAQMVKLSQARKTVDAATMGKDGEILQELLTQLTPAHHAPLEEYAAIVRRDSFRRKMIASLEKVISRVAHEEDKEKLLTELGSVTAAIMEGAEDGMLLSPAAAMELYLDELVSREAGRRGLRYGIEPLDSLLNPAKPGDMIVVAARPSVGKSALADNIADNWAVQSEHPVLFVSIEMTVPQLMDRAVSRVARIDASRVTRCQLTAEEKERMVKVVHDRQALKIWYLDDPHATTGSIRAAAARIRHTHGGISGIIIDYLQILKDDGKETEVQRVTRISRNIKALGREFNCPVLALSQLNRSVELREDQSPKLHDLRESGAIEQDADVVVGLRRELGTPDMWVEVLKNRNGKVGKVRLDFDTQYMVFAKPDPVAAAVA